MADWLSELRFTEEPYSYSAVANRPLEGRAVAVLGGGPSLTPAIAKALAHPKPPIVVNNSYQLTPRPSLLVVMDRRWFEWHAGALASTPHTILVGLRRGGSIPYQGHYRKLDRERDPTLMPNSGVMVGTNTGHAAVALAVFMGARAVYTAGFDMGFPGGKSHWHEQHRIPPSEANYVSRFRPKFEKLVRMAQDQGCAVASVTPTFASVPTVPLEHALEDLQHDKDSVDNATPHPSL